MVEASGSGTCGFRGCVNAKMGEWICRCIDDDEDDDDDYNDSENENGNENNDR